MADPEPRGSAPSGQSRKGLSTVAGHAVADGPVVARRPGNAGGAKGTGHPALPAKQLPGQEDSKGKARPKPFAISKQVVWEAYRRVKANKGAAGVDEQSLQEFEQDLKDNLFSGCISSSHFTGFKFLGYEFRARRARGREGRLFDGFNPAISPDEAKRIRSEMRSWRLCRWTTMTLQELAAWVNPRVQGWINYYGLFYQSLLIPLFRHLDGHLARWARRKYKRLANSRARAYNFLSRIFQQAPTLFAHWRLGVRP